jgi:hypothetical protein
MDDTPDSQRIVSGSQGQGPSPGDAENKPSGSSNFREQYIIFTPRVRNKPRVSITLAEHHAVQDTLEARR